MNNAIYSELDAKPRRACWGDSIVDEWNFALEEATALTTNLTETDGTQQEGRCTRFTEVMCGRFAGIKGRVSKTRTSAAASSTASAEFPRVSTSVESSSSSRRTRIAVPVSPGKVRAAKATASITASRSTLSVIRRDDISQDAIEDVKRFARRGDVVGLVAA